MSKLFGKEDDLGSIEMGRITRNGEEISLNSINLEEVVEDYSSYMELATEHLSDLQYKFHLAISIENSFVKSELGSKEYLYSLEERSELVRGLANNLGVKVHVASLEDFHSTYSMESSHEVALEGIKEFFRKIWERIKAFFKSFWKKVSTFFKRLTGANLEMDTYEKYVDEMMRRIKRDNLECRDKTTELSNKLPRFISPMNMEFKDSVSVTSNFKAVSTNFSRSIRDGLLPNLDKLKGADGGLSKVRSGVRSIASDLKSGTITVNQLALSIHEVISDTNFILRMLVGNSTTSYNSIPDEVRSKFSETIRGSKASGTLYSLVDSNEDSVRLPKYFNIYVSSPDINKDELLKELTQKEDVDAASYVKELYSTAISTYLKEDLVSTDRLLPIDTINGLTDFHDSYKNFKLDMKKIDSTIRDVEKLIEEVIKTASSGIDNYSDITANKHMSNKEIEDLKLPILIGEVTSKEAHNRILTLLGMEEMLMNLNSEIGESPEVINSKIIETISNHGLSGEQVIAIVTIIKDHDPEAVSKSTDTLNVLGEKVNLGRTVAAYQSAILKTLDVYKLVLGSVFTDVSKLYTEFRYEAIKYMYDSCRRYG